MASKAPRGFSTGIKHPWPYQTGSVWYMQFVCAPKLLGEYWSHRARADSWQQVHLKSACFQCMGSRDENVITMKRMVLMCMDHFLPTNKSLLFCFRHPRDNCSGCWDCCYQRLFLWQIPGHEQKRPTLCFSKYHLSQKLFNYGREVEASSTQVPIIFNGDLNPIVVWGPKCWWPWANMEREQNMPFGLIWRWWA